jgi:hypothetical protein
MLIDNLVTRFPGGVNNESVASIFNSLQQYSPTRYHWYMEDFDYYTAANWTVTVVGSGTAALVSGDGGILALTNSAALNDLTQIQKVGPSFLMTPGSSSGAGKKLFLRSQFSVDDATNSALAIGLQVTNTDGTLTTVTDGVYFTKPAASTSLSFNARFNATTGAQTGVVGTLANATIVKVDAFYDGIDRFYYGINGTIIGYLTVNTTSGIPDVAIQPIAVVKNGTAVARTLSLDYLFAAQER